MERNTEMCKEWRGDVFMNTKRIITIGRQFGSGGREVGQKLAERLGIPYYDRELLARGIDPGKIYHYGFAFQGKNVLIG